MAFCSAKSIRRMKQGYLSSVRLKILVDTGKGKRLFFREIVKEGFWWKVFSARLSLEWKA